MANIKTRVSLLAAAAAVSAQLASAATVNLDTLTNKYLPLGETILPGTDFTGTFSQPNGINGTFSYGAMLGDDGSTMWQRSLNAFETSQTLGYNLSTTEGSLHKSVWENTRIVTPGHYVETTKPNAISTSEFRQQNFGTEVLDDGTVQLTMNTGIIAEGTPKTFVAVEGTEDFFVVQDEDGAPYGLFAQGLEPDTYTYVQEAEGGAYPVGTEINPDELNFSENARVSVKVELEEGGAPQFTSAFAGIGFDMEPAGININLQPNGDVIDATQYHVTDVPDHIHVRIDGREDLDALQASLVSGEGFNIEASSTLGRRAETHTIVGEGDFAEDLGQTAQVLQDGATFRFEPTNLVQRVLNYSPTSEPLDPSIADSCETLGLDQLGLTANDVVLLPARVIAGTGVLPRESEGIVAVDPANHLHVLAAAERHFVGQNMGADGKFHSTISRSAANDHDAIEFGGCTGVVTQTGAPTPETTRTWVPPVIETTTGTNQTLTSLTGGFIGVTTGGTGVTFTDTGTTTPGASTVPIEGAEFLVVAAAGAFDRAAGTNIEGPVHDFLDRNWTPLESGPLMLGGALGGTFFLLGGASGNRRRKEQPSSAPKPATI